MSFSSPFNIFDSLIPIPTPAITDPIQAEQIVATELADAVFLARHMLRDSYWPLHAAKDARRGSFLAGPLCAGEVMVNRANAD